MTPLLQNPVIYARVSERDNMIIRPEAPSDIPRIAAITRAAFADHLHSDQREHLIVDALRVTGALTISLVAEVDRNVVGHVGFSPVSLATGVAGWYGLGPLSVSPQFQRCGVGTALVEEGLKRLRHLGAAGCVVAGDPEYYKRFGFVQTHDLYLEGFPAEYFSAIIFIPGGNAGVVTYHPAFLGK